MSHARDSSKHARKHAMHACSCKDRPFLMFPCSRIPWNSAAWRSLAQPGTLPRSVAQRTNSYFRSYSCTKEIHYLWFKCLFYKLLNFRCNIEMIWFASSHYPRSSLLRSWFDVVDRIQWKVALKFGLVVEFGIDVIRCADSILPQLYLAQAK